MRVSQSWWSHPQVGGWLNRVHGLQIWPWMMDYLLGAVGEGFLTAKGDALEEIHSFSSAHCYTWMLWLKLL